MKRLKAIGNRLKQAEESAAAFENARINGANVFLQNLATVYGDGHADTVKTLADAAEIDRMVETAVLKVYGPKAAI